ncbi:hypothetical protein Halha_1274 [Halobacteroides halobius DSM 5150]|uniref:Uncharacterized protein n=1 Tax=Halobacteroides halobius (strain ATCC 35273 / DSM 5150 / MD-1) TaxID=748449 RepID=L0K9K4_HALHC|nr:hypothetical protein [Halobacteroides halobius]AGB41220.1 hypothetical protein Halha_1274 [Halobacteroides halobius DSM 5150]
MCGPREENKQVTIDIVESIIEQRKAVAHLLNTEVQKIQQISQLTFSIKQLMIMQQHLVSIVKSSLQIQIILQSKLEEIFLINKLQLRELIVENLEVIIFLEVVVDNLLDIENKLFQEHKCSCQFSKEKLSNFKRNFNLIMKAGERMKEVLHSEINQLQLYL